jgi:septal ring-binding cell division protein DamX
MDMDSTIIKPAPKRIMLPILVILFMFSYGLLALLVVEQGRTIESQRDLIRDIFSDSAQLSAMKMSAARKQNEAKARSQVHEQTPSTQAQAPSSQSTQTQSQTPSSQVMQQDKLKTGDARKLRKAVPQKPPTAASDSPDVRRNVFHI